MAAQTKKICIACVTVLAILLTSIALPGLLSPVSFAEAGEWGGDLAPEDPGDLDPDGSGDPDGTEPPVEPEEPGTLEPEAPEPPDEPQPEPGDELPEEAGGGEEDDDSDKEGVDGGENEAPKEDTEPPCCEIEDCEGNSDCAHCLDCVACNRCVNETFDLLDYITAEDGWTEVDTGAKLLTAIEAGKEQIRLTDDVTMTGSPVLRNNLVIDGLTPDGKNRYKIDEGGTGRIIRLAKPGLEVTVQNVEIKGYDYFGFVTQDGYGSAANNTEVTYRNVEYRGPQLAYLRWNGTLIVEDSMVYLVSNGGHPVNELGEAGQYIFGGHVEIHRNDSSHSVMWIYNEGSGSKKEGLIEIRDGATLIIRDTTSYLYHKETNSNGPPTATFKVGDNATVDMYTRNGWCDGSGQYFDRFEIGENSTVLMRRDATGEYYRLYIDKELKVGKGSIWIVEDAQPAVNLRSAGVTVEFDDPALIRLDNYISGYKPGSMTITGKAFNTWLGGVDGEPGMLNGPAGEPVTMTWDGSNLRAHYTSAETGGAVSLDPGSVNPLSTGSKRFVVGDYTLDIDPITTASTGIAGILSGDGMLSATYYPWDADVGDPSARRTAAAQRGAEQEEPPVAAFTITPGSSGENGTGAFARDQEIQFDLVRTVQPSWTITKPTRLHAREYRTPEDHGVLSLVSVPETLDFGVRSIPGVTTYFPLSRDADFVVVDSRTAPESARWSLRAKAQPLRDSVTGEPLENSVIGLMKDGVFNDLLSGAVVWSGERDAQQDEHSLTFPAGDRQNGFVVSIDPYHARDSRYESRIIWTLTAGL